MTEISREAIDTLALRLHPGGRVERVRQLGEDVALDGTEKGIGYGAPIEVDVREGDDALLAELTPEGYRAVPERVVLFRVRAWDVNCPQHIPVRYEADEVAARSLIAVGEYPVNESHPAVEQAVWTQVSSLLFNLSETLTRL